MAKLPREEWDGYLVWLEDYEYEKLGLPRPTAVAFLDMPTEVSQRLLSHRYAGDESRKDIHERTWLISAAAGRRRCMRRNGSAGRS